MEPVVPTNEDSVVEFSSLDKKVSDAIVNFSERKVAVDSLAQKINGTLDFLLTTQAKLHMVLKLTQSLTGIDGRTTSARHENTEIRHSSALLDKMDPVKEDIEEADIQRQTACPVLHSFNNNVQKAVESSPFSLSDDFHPVEIIDLLQQIENLSKLFRSNEAVNMNSFSTNVAFTRGLTHQVAGEVLSTDNALFGTDDATIAHTLTFVEKMNGSSQPKNLLQGQGNSIEHDNSHDEGVKKRFDLDQMNENENVGDDKLKKKLVKSTGTCMEMKSQAFEEKERAKTVSCYTRTFADSSTSTNVTRNTRKQSNEYPGRSSNKFYWRSSVLQQLKRNQISTPVIKSSEAEPQNVKTRLRKNESKSRNSSTTKMDKEIEGEFKGKLHIEKHKTSVSTFEDFLTSMNLDFKIKGLTLDDISEKMSATILHERNSKEKMEREVRLQTAYSGPTVSGKLAQRPLTSRKSCTWDKELEKTSKQILKEMRKAKEMEESSKNSTLKYGNFKKIIENKNKKLEKTSRSRCAIEPENVKGETPSSNKIEKQNVLDANNMPMPLAANSTTKGLNESDTSRSYSLEKSGSFSRRGKVTATMK